MSENHATDAGEVQRLSDLMRGLEKVVLGDGKVDMGETAVLLRLVGPLAEREQGDFAAFAAALREIRADGVVTSEESERLRLLIAALVDRADEFKVIACPKCNRPVSLRTIVSTDDKCPWCGAPLA